MVCDRVKPDRIKDELGSTLNEELRQAEGRHRMVVEGIFAVQAAKTPEEVGRATRQAAP
jgi:hypothetical protein